MIAALRDRRREVPIATTNSLGDGPLFSLPALTDGDVVDVHSYGKSEALSVNPRYEANFLAWTAAAQVHGKPLAITEWNVPVSRDRPLHRASVRGRASRRFRDGMLPCFTITRRWNSIGRARDGSKLQINKWSTFYDPALTGVMPAAAIAFRRGHISPAKTAYCLKLEPKQLFETVLSPEQAPPRSGPSSSKAG